MMEGPEITGRPANKMPFGDAVKTCFSKSFTLEGRASRSEFWFFELAYLLAAFGLTAADVALGGVGITILLLAFIPAGICASVRRLHDLGKSGWMILVSIIPLVGGIILLVWFVSDGQPHANSYGDVPTNTAE